MKGKSVVQEWISELPMMQQTVLLECIRGCDGLQKRHISKFILRYFRRCLLYSAMDTRVIADVNGEVDPHDSGGGNFTGPIPNGTTVHELFGQYFDSHDEVAHHFHMHLVHAAEIIGYKHPSPITRSNWHDFYMRAVKDLHLQPETEQRMDFRLGDSEAQWQEAGGEVLDLGRG